MVVILCISKFVVVYILMATAATTETHAPTYMIATDSHEFLPHAARSTQHTDGDAWHSYIFC